ncbi:hypothetical protein O1L60_01190 [Streptomyces diastatochromogenes]|nr:hypothetical protein [Streptomyces diastatochromogenes]
MVSAQTAQDTSVGLGGITGTADGADLAGAKFDLAFHCAETHDAGGEPGECSSDSSTPPTCTTRTPRGSCSRCSSAP